MVGLIEPLSRGVAVVFIRIKDLRAGPHDIEKYLKQRVLGKEVSHIDRADIISGRQMRRVIDQGRFTSVSRNTVIADPLVPVVIQGVTDAGAQARIRDDQLKSSVCLRQDRDQGLFKIPKYRFIRRHDHTDAGHMMYFQHGRRGPERVFRFLSPLEAVPHRSLIEKNRCFRLMILVLLPARLLAALIIGPR